MALLNAITLKSNSLVLNAAGKHSNKYVMLFFPSISSLCMQSQKKNPFLFFLVTSQLYSSIDTILKSTYKYYSTFSASLASILSYVVILMLMILNSFLAQKVLQSDLLKLSQQSASRVWVANILVVTLSRKGIVFGFIT